MDCCGEGLLMWHVGGDSGDEEQLETVPRVPGCLHQACSKDMPAE